MSNNRLSSLEGLSTLTALTTLAAAHNELRDLPSLAFATNLEQLRLNDNKLLTLASTLTSNARSVTILWAAVMWQSPNTDRSCVCLSANR